MKYIFIHAKKDMITQKNDGKKNKKKTNSLEALPKAISLNLI